MGSQRYPDAPARPDDIIDGLSGGETNRGISGTVSQWLSVAETVPDALGPGSVARSVVEKLGEIVSARDFYEPTDASFHTAINKAVANRVTAGGGGVWIPTGYYTFADGGVDLADAENVVIFGDGMGATRVKQSTSNVCFTRSINAETNIRFIEIRDLTIIGQWEENQSLGGDNDRAISIHKADIARIIRVESLYNRQMGLKASQCGEVHIEGCRVQYCARDGINCDSSHRAKIINNTIRHCNDDGIALHTVTTIGDNPNWGQIVTGNFLEDTHGIKLLGAVKAIVAHNQGHRCKGYHFKVDDESATNQGLNDVYGLTLAHNIFHDCINPALYGSTNQLNSVYIGSRSDAQLAIEPGSPPTINKPENFVYQSNNASNERAGGHAIHIVGNSIRQTLKNGVDYSDWGFGELYYKDGWLDPEITATGHMLSGSGIVLNGALADVCIEGNDISGFSRCVRPVAPQSRPGNSPMTIKNNRFIRFATCAIGNSESEDFILPYMSEGNFFDGDPYFESDRRTTPLDGTWLSNSQYPVAFVTTHQEYVVSDGDTFRNLAEQLYRTDTASQFLCRRPKVIGDPVQFKGIGGLGKMPIPETQFICEDSDPRSNTYGQPLRSGLISGNSANSPVRGIFVAGQLVYRNPLAASQALGWGVVTSGSANSGAWASGQNYTVPTVRKNSSNKVYALVTAGGGTTANEPTHDYGTATEADGYVWRFEAPQEASFKTMGSLSA